MKIGLFDREDGYWYFHDKDLGFENWCYVYSDLKLDNCYFNRILYFKNHKTEIKFCEKYNLAIKYYCLSEIKKENLKAYNWLKKNFGKGLYSFDLFYDNKEELRNCIKKIITINIRGKLK